MRRRSPSYRLTQQNPLPASRFPDEDASRSPGASGADVARQGYCVLDRANPRHSWDANRRGMAPPVTEDGPDLDWDTTRTGYLT